MLLHLTVLKKAGFWAWYATNIGNLFVAIFGYSFVSCGNVCWMLKLDLLCVTYFLWKFMGIPLRRLQL